MQESTLLKWYENIAYELNIPLLIVDVPYNHGDEVTEENIKYVESQLYDIIHQLELICKKPFDMDKFQEVMKIASDNATAWYGATSLPQNREAKSAEAFLESEYKYIKEKLEEILGITITEKALEDSIVLYNDYRSEMRRFVEIASNRTDIITPLIRHKIIKASYFMDKKDYLEYIKELNKRLRLMPANRSKNKRIVVTGIMLEPDGVIEYFEKYGMDIVGDDLAHESRQFRTDAPFSGRSLNSLAKRWTSHSACSLAFDPYKERIQYLVDLVNHHNADGLVIALMKFCDPEEYDVPIIMDRMKKENIPLQVIEIDQQAKSFEQINTRLQSFAENI